jgi:surfeit locus 1 family protein
MRLSTIIIVVLMLAGLAVLCSLGWWQVERLFWKEELLRTVQERVSRQPVPVDEFLGKELPKDQWSYTPVTVTGTFNHQAEVYYFATGQSGASGWNVHTPLEREDGTAVVVNRGFVPFDMKAPEKRPEGQVDGLQTVTGLIRVPAVEKPSAAFENAPEKREFYWRDLEAMTALMRSGSGQTFLPLLVEADETANPGGWPKGGTTIIKFSNNHLQYAITWFGLAATMLGVGGYFLYSRRKSGADA